MTTPGDRTRRPFALDEAVAILARTPAALDALLRGLPDGWIAAHEGGETWSPFDVVGHLIHGERTDWMPRARIIMEHGEARPFDKFDRFAQFDASEGRTLASLLDEFAALRKQQPARAGGPAPERGGPRSSRDAPRARRRDAASAPGDLGGARPRSPRADLTSAGTAVRRRSRSLARLPADHQREPGLVGFRRSRRALRTSGRCDGTEELQPANLRGSTSRSHGMSRRHLPDSLLMSGQRYGASSILKKGTYTLARSNE